MAEFNAQALVETKTTDRNRIQLTFADARGMRQTVTLPTRLAADLVPVLAALTDAATQAGPRFTRSPKALAVGRAEHERLVLLKFDDDPPYALEPDRAEDLWREVREEAEFVASMKAPAIQ
ncbi:MAG: hypothetical protein NW223_01280 [Hyphomicrobiaceae bacterium]|nr:hypothetical protein [Hyphomicrobiaceae bacterium]